MRLSVLLILVVGVPASAGRPAHLPVQPKPDAPVVVSITIEGASKATLKLQAVAPGKYIRKGDPAYEKDWADLPMQADGKGGFSVSVPKSYQQHRWLIRYRIVAEVNGKPVQYPAADDPCPNYAWWCDAGPAAWKGSREPGKVPPLEFSSEFLGTLQSLHLIARGEDVAKSQWDGNANRQKMQGTIVYRGIVSDHIQYSNRGQGSAHISGKNKWGIKFHHEHEVPFQDHDGVPFPDTISSLNLNPGGSTPYIPVLRGIAGLDEVLSMRAYRLAGVPSPPATWVQWRVVSRVDEVDAKDQSKGDLWGLYVAVGEMTPKLLADRKLPDGLVVSIQSGIKHTPKGLEGGDKIWEKFLSGIRANQTEDWWRANLDVNAYYSFHAINRLVGNVDLRPDGNHGYYRHPDGQWAPIPWDNDMMFVPRQHQPGYIEAINCLKQPKLALECRNRAREIQDLFASDASPTGGQIGQFTADLGGSLTPKKFTVDWPKLDDALWNQHPRMNQKGSYYINPLPADHFGGPWTRTLATNNFAGFQKYIVDFCTDTRPKKNYAPNDGDQRGYGWGYLAYEAKDEKIPATPAVERLKGFTFKASTGSGVLEWRVGRIGRKGWYELADHWRKDGDAEIAIPAEVFQQPGEYRVRARWRDSTGRTSHWSPPVSVSQKP